MAIDAQWGRRDGPLALRQIALVVRWSFEELWRFADASMVNIAFIYWFPAKVGHLAYKLLRRKNDQWGLCDWSVVAHTGAKDSLALRVRAFVRDSNPGLVIPDGGGFARGRGETCFVFREFGRASWDATGYNHFGAPGTKVFITGDGRTPLSCGPRKHYRRFLTAVRRALVVCCGLSKAQAKLFGLQSMRRGGNTFLFKTGASKERRLRKGFWKTPAMDAEYIQELLEDQLQFKAKTAAAAASTLGASTAVPLLTL